MEQIWSQHFAHPLAPVLTIILAVLVILLAQRWFGRLNPSALQTKLGAGGVGVGLFWCLATLWAVLALLLFCGLLWTIFQILTGLIPEQGRSADIWKWRFSILKLASLTAVLGAVVALPFTLIRLGLNRQQVETALEALTNDKMNTTVDDLHAQRQVTRWTDDEASNGWEDDITRRNGAIDRFLGLVQENETLRPRVDRMLTVYLRELTREYPATTVPSNATHDKSMQLARELKPIRSDMENAVQTLSRLPRPNRTKGEEWLPDLNKINMQGFDLANLDLNGANLRGAQLQGAILLGTQLQGAKLSGALLLGSDLSVTNLQGADLFLADLQGANLSGASLQGADLRMANLKHVTLYISQLRGAALKDVNLANTPDIAPHLIETFGDRSVLLSEEMEYPSHWAQAELAWGDFETAWREFQRSIGQDPDNPQ